MPEPFALRLELDPTSGQLRSLHDASGAMILACGTGPELEWNSVPLRTRLIAIDVARGEHISLLAARLEPSYGAAVELRIRRLVTVAGTLNHPGHPGTANLRYEVQRVPVESDAEGLDYIWQPRIEAACRLDTLTVLAQPQQWFGNGTRLRNLAMGGSGPREHVSLEDGPIAEVIPWLQSGFRSVFPGQLTVNGGLYWHPEGEPFVWIFCQRPATGGQIEFGLQRHAYRFTYHREVALSEVVHTPAITVTWGRGLASADSALARMFTAYVEPEPWWYRTTWFWLHPQWQPGGNFRAMGEGARILQQECGVNGFGLLTHTVPTGGSDVDMISPAPDHALGGDDELRRAVAGIRERGGRAFVWFSRLGHRPDTPARQNSWPVRGVDGRPIRTTYRAGAGVTFDVNNAADPTYQEYLMEWMEHYIKRIGVQGIFWDSGFQPLPADFGGKDYLRWPGEAAASGVALHDRLYRFGKSIDPDFFMWAEGISTDHVMNAFAVDARSTGGQSTHRQMHRIAHAGSKRIVWRSAWAHELASGFPWIDPASDIHGDPGPESYRRAAADPMNRWICRTVAEHGCRSAIGLGDGISQLSDYVVRSPGSPESSIIIATQAQQLRHEITGESITGTRTANGLSVTLPRSGAWRLCA